MQQKISFTKMQGLGNDFVVIDATQKPFHLTSAQIQQMANRRFGVGFDQLLVLEPPKKTNTDFNFRIFNADGSEVGQCGNGARCMAIFIRAHHLSDKDSFRLGTLADILELKMVSEDKVSVRMGIPEFSPEKIPFLVVEDQLLHPVILAAAGKTVQISVANVGNPHAVIQVDQINSEEVGSIGKELSQHASFPEGVNVSFMQLINPKQIRLRVYERGTGETLACGSAACAAVAIGRRRGLLQERVVVDQPGGSLTIDWQGPQMPVIMTGPGKIVFYGEYLL